MKTNGSPKTQTWPELAIGLYEQLTGRGAEIAYEMNDLEIFVPSGTGAERKQRKLKSCTELSPARARERCRSTETSGRARDNARRRMERLGWRRPSCLRELAAWTIGLPSRIRARKARSAPTASRASSSSVSTRLLPDSMRPISRHARPSKDQPRARREFGVFAAKGLFSTLDSILDS